MKKIFIIAISLAFGITPISAQQSYKETFDSNSMEWTECSARKALGTAIIDKGVMKLTSKGEKTMSGRPATFFETHCYVPFYLEKPFIVKAKVKALGLDWDREVGLVFNYRDGGNFYTFALNNDYVSFQRYEDYKLVGEICQNLKLKRFNVEMEWELIYNGEMLMFKVDGSLVHTIRHMPLTYTGFGFYAYGKQVLQVDEVEFIQ